MWNLCKERREGGGGQGRTRRIGRRKGRTLCRTMGWGLGDERKGSAEERGLVLEKKRRGID